MLVITAFLDSWFISASRICTKSLNELSRLAILSMNSRFSSFFFILDYRADIWFLSFCLSSLLKPFLFLSWFLQSLILLFDSSTYFWVSVCFLPLGFLLLFWDVLEWSVISDIGLTASLWWAGLDFTGGAEDWLKCCLGESLVTASVAFRSTFPARLSFKALWKDGSLERGET